MAPAARTRTAYQSLASAHMPRTDLSDKESEFVCCHGLPFSFSFFICISGINGKFMSVGVVTVIPSHFTDLCPIGLVHPGVSPL